MNTKGARQSERVLCQCCVRVYKERIVLCVIPVTICLSVGPPLPLIMRCHYNGGWQVGFYSCIDHGHKRRGVSTSSKVVC